MMTFRTFFSTFTAFLLLTFAPATSCSAAMLQRIADDIGTTARNNIENAERLFCYIVANKSQGYTGYTIDNMAVTGFCGIIDDNLRNMLFEQFFSTQNNIDFNRSENCTIQPRVLLRYVRGVDNTDVLLSSPCHSMTIFYGGKIQTYNMKTAEYLLETVTNAFQANHIKFVSPALINQLLPIGVPQNAQQKAVLTKPTEAKRSWASAPTSQQNTSYQGWNNLNFAK